MSRPPRLTGVAPIKPPSGTRPINKAPQIGGDSGLLHGIKEGIGAAANDWVGIAPNGDIITTGENGETVVNGNVSDYK